MANSEHLAKLKEGAAAWNQWRKGYWDHLLDLTGASLEGTDLSGANLAGTNLSGAILRNVNLLDADFSETELSNTDLSDADLSNADFFGADLAEADLTNANLEGAQFTFTELEGAILERTNLSNATFLSSKLSRATFAGSKLGYTQICDVDLSGVLGLESVFHLGPSSIGIDTIYKSRGKIPHVFLRGAGVPENFIQYMASLVGTGIEFYSLFISYSHKNEEFAKRLHADLQANGVRCWYAPEDMPGGKKLHEEIDAAIRMHDKLLLILSEHSMESEWVKTEISKARKREVRDGKRILFPIRLCSFETLRDWECFDADTGKDSAREIREYFIPDFSNWKDHDAYRLAFDRLLKDLQEKADQPPA